MRTKLQARIVAGLIFVTITLISLAITDNFDNPPPGFGVPILFVTIIIYRGFLKPNPNRPPKTKSEDRWWRRGLFNKKKTSSEVTEKSTNDVSHQEDSLTFTSTYSVDVNAGDSTDKWHKQRRTINYILIFSIILNIALGTLLVITIMEKNLWYDKYIKESYEGFKVYD